MLKVIFNTNLSYALEGGPSVQLKMKFESRNLK